MRINYGAVLSDSFKVFWKYKVLWGIAVLLRLAGWLSNIVISFYSETISIPPAWLLPPGASASNERLLIDWPRFLLIFLAANLLAVITSLIIRAPLRGALVGMLQHGDMEGILSLRAGWQAAKGQLKPLFWLLVVLDLPIILIDLLMLAVLTYAQVTFIGENSQTGAYAAASLIMLCGMCGIVIFAAIIYNLMLIIGSLAARACVLERLNTAESLRRGWQMARRNLGYVVLNSLVLWLMGLIYRYLAGLPSTPFWTPLRQAFEARSWSSLSPFQVVDYLLYYLFFFILIDGLLSGFSETVWSRLYGEFVKREAVSAGAEALPRVVI
jgi:hypothetical protein